MKDYIDIYDELGNKKQMEIVATFKLESFNYNYIIYTDLNKQHFYIGKYIEEEKAELITDFSNEELIMCNKVFREVLKNAGNKQE